MKQLLILLCLGCCVFPLQAATLDAPAELNDVQTQFFNTQSSTADTQGQINDALTGIREAQDQMRGAQKRVQKVQNQGVEELAALKGTMTDQAAVMAPEAITRIDQQAEHLAKATGVNLRILVVRTLETPDFNSYGRQLYDRWDVGGRNQGLDRGVLLIVSLLDSQVKIVAGKELEQYLTATDREGIEQGILAQLAKGKMAEGVELGATAITQQLISDGPAQEKPGQINWKKASWPLFLLFILSVAVTLVVGGGFLMAFGTVVGGLFGYIFLGIFGLIMGALLGFFLFFGRSEQRELRELFGGKDDNKK
jgi:uncharacterized membrane protein YgcG